MKIFLKSFSTSVHNQEHDQDPQPEAATAPTTTSDHHHQHLSTSLTVWRKSLLTNCHGFTVIDSQGDLAYRVDSYMGRPPEVTLMDTVGNSILTMRRRKKLGMMLVDSWLVYEGEVGYNHSARTKMEKKRATWCVKKSHSTMFLQTNNKKKNVLARVYRVNDEEEEEESCVYAIQGSYANRSCKIMEVGTRKVVAEMKRKEEVVGGVSYGVDVFVLGVESGFDPGFAMGLVLILDQMF